MTGNQTDKRSFDIAASGDAQAQFNSVAAELEALMDARDADVKAAMSNYQADGASEEYHAKELQWNAAAGDVRNIISTLRTALEQNDESARNALTRAKGAVAGI
jgi:uncharacterized protein YukE